MKKTLIILLTEIAAYEGWRGNMEINQEFTNMLLYVHSGRNPEPDEILNLIKKYLGKNEGINKAIHQCLTLPLHSVVRWIKENTVINGRAQMVAA